MPSGNYKNILHRMMLLSLFMLSGVAFSQTQTQIQTPVVKDTIIISSLDFKSGNDGRAIKEITRSDAVDRAHRLGLSLHPDMPPVTSDRGFFLQKYQTVIPVKGYNKELIYKIYIDFFKYSGGDIRESSLLKFYISDRYGRKNYIGSASSEDIHGDNIFELAVPFDLSYTGSFDIIIQDCSDRTGFWGIWDIIVSSKKLRDLEKINIDTTPRMEEVKEKIFK